MSEERQRFERTNLRAAKLEQVRAHGGDGSISFARILSRSAVDGPVNFVDLAVLPPGVSIGSHTHSLDEEEYYLILEGNGAMTQDASSFEVTSGDLIRNAPGSAHELRNTGSVDLRIFVFEVEVST